MAIYHATSKPISRNSGHSATAKSAYINGNKIYDERTGLSFDYTKKKGIIGGEIVLPNNIKLTDLTSEVLWNNAEQAENRKDARVGREWEISLPHELSDAQRQVLTKEISSTIANKYNVACEYSIHTPSKSGDQRNHHVHILTTTRIIDKNGNLGEKSSIELSNTKLDKLKLPRSEIQITEMRATISDLINKHLQQANINEVVSHLSLKDQGIDRIPTVHKGKAITELERKQAKTKVTSINKKINSANQEITLLESQVFDDGAELAKIQKELEQIRRRKKQNSIYGKAPKAYSNALFSIALEYGDFLKRTNNGEEKYYQSKNGNVKVYDNHINVENSNERDIKFTLDIAIHQFGNYLKINGDEKFLNDVIKTIAANEKYKNIVLADPMLNKRLIEARISMYEISYNKIYTNIIQSAVDENITQPPQSINQQETETSSWEHS